jgi:hypothetical protein
LKASKPSLKEPKVKIRERMDSLDIAVEIPEKPTMRNSK